MPELKDLKDILSSRGVLPRSTLSEEEIKEETKHYSHEWAKDCPACKGAGFVHPRLDTGKPDYSKTITCPCYLKYIRQPEGLRKSGLNPEQTFENFELNPKNQGAFDAALFFSEPDSPAPMLLIYGGIGNGKSHICRSVAIRMRTHGYSVKLQTVSDFFGNCHGAIEKKNFEQFYDELKHWPVLILDDLKAESLTNWAIEHLENLVDYRYNECLNQHPLRTMITTNLDKVAKEDGFKPIPPRILSRFSDYKVGKVVLNKDIDHRPGK